MQQIEHLADKPSELLDLAVKDARAMMAEDGVCVVPWKWHEQVTARMLGREENPERVCLMCLAGAVVHRAADLHKGHEMVPDPRDAKHAFVIHDPGGDDEQEIRGKIANQLWALDAIVHDNTAEIVRRLCGAFDLNLAQVERLSRAFQNMGPELNYDARRTGCIGMVDEPGETRIHSISEALLHKIGTAAAELRKVDL